MTLGVALTTPGLHGRDRILFIADPPLSPGITPATLPCSGAVKQHPTRITPEADQGLVLLSYQTPLGFRL
jgi:hypothetical protein